MIILLPKKQKTQMNNCISINNLNKVFSSSDSSKASVFEGLNLTFPMSKITSILGPSGCGKTTLLNLIAGLEKPTSGNIVFPKNYQLPLGYMMQEDLLLPWRTLKENARLGAEVVGNKNELKEKELENLFVAFELSKSVHNYPNSSSGGMKQRTALIRTLYYSPKILLLDEPFSSLDFETKLKIQKYILKYQFEKNATIILVTHDIEDAVALSDKVIILSEKPTKIKKIISIKLGSHKRNLAVIRQSANFKKYFLEIWNEISTNL